MCNTDPNSLGEILTEFDADLDAFVADVNKALKLKPPAVSSNLLTAEEPPPSCLYIHPGDAAELRDKIRQRYGRSLG